MNGRAVEEKNASYITIKSVFPYFTLTFLVCYVWPQFTDNYNVILILCVATQGNQSIK